MKTLFLLMTVCAGMFAVTACSSDMPQTSSTTTTTEETVTQPASTTTTQTTVAPQ